MTLLEAHRPILLGALAPIGPHVDLTAAAARAHNAASERLHQEIVGIGRNVEHGLPGSASRVTLLAHVGDCGRRIGTEARFGLSVAD